MRINESSVILDTNAYRSMVSGLLLEDSVEVALKLRKRDESNRNLAFASPIVIWELIAHLACPIDPAYTDCLHAILALSIHTRESESKHTIKYIPHPSTSVCTQLFGTTPITSYYQTINLIDIAYRIAAEAPVLSESTNRRIEELAEALVDMKQNWIENMIALTEDHSAIDGDKWFGTNKKSARRIVSDFYASDEFKSIIAYGNVMNYAEDIGIKISQTALKQKANAYLELYPVVVQYVARFIKKLPSPYRINFRSKKKRHANLSWDVALCYAIGNATIAEKPSFFVTDDSGILDAAEDVGLRQRVLKSQEYLPSRTDSEHRIF